MSEFKRYRNVKTKHRRVDIVEFRPWSADDNLDGVTLHNGETPQAGDMIARNPNHHPQQWIVTAQDFADNFEPA